MSNTAIIVKPVKDGWEARKGGSKIIGKGPSSVEAHCDLLERAAEAHAERNAA